MKFDPLAIRKKRKELKLSAPQLAELLNVSLQNLYKWEKGTRPTNPEDYIKLESWLTGKLEIVPNSIMPETKEEKPDQNKAIENLSESNLILARSVERAIGLIANAQSGTLLSPQFAADIQNLIEEIVSGKKQMSMADLQKRLNKVLVLHTSGR